MLHIEKINYNDFDDLISNTYIIYDDNGVAVVVDPGASNNSVSAFLDKRNLLLKAILLTHGHVDHIRGVDKLVKNYKSEVYIHLEDEKMLTNPLLNCSSMMGENLIVESACKYIENNQLLKIFEEDDIKVIHTPFHTRGSVCYYFINNKWLFSGDTLFKESIGRDDLPNSFPNKVNESLGKIKQLPKETKIYPGHGQNAVLESELMLNHFLIN